MASNLTIEGSGKGNNWPIIILVTFLTGGNATYTHLATEDRFRGSDAQQLRQEFDALKEELTSMERQIATFATSGPAEVRADLKELKELNRSILNELLLERSRYPRFPTKGAKR